MSRLDNVVRGYELGLAQYILLESLRSGRTVGDAIAAAADATPVSDDELAAELEHWFSQWTQQRILAIKH